jgi:hypothetical protein
VVSFLVTLEVVTVGFLVSLVPLTVLVLADLEVSLLFVVYDNSPYFSIKALTSVIVFVIFPLTKVI